MSEVNMEAVITVVKMSMGRVWRADQALRGQRANKKLAREILAALLVDLENLQKHIEEAEGE